MTMKYQLLGRTGLFVSRFALGTATFGGASHPLYKVVGGLPQSDANRIVGLALDAGVNLFDSADIYAVGESERMLGIALGARRKDAVIATKIGNRSEAGPNAVGQSRVHLLQGIDNSLRRLNTDYIDLLQLHTYDPLTDIDDVLRTLTDAVRAGKIRYFGCSNFAAWQLMKAMGAANRLGALGFASLQAYYSLVSRDIERELVPAVIDQQLGLLTWCPLAAGLLTGKFTRSQKPSDAAGRQGTCI
jgi:aryl-alcohol dehydrogenase-like predicted oxidoreductase